MKKRDLLKRIEELEARIAYLEAAQHSHAPFVQMCTCPPTWHGIVPPSCPVHNPCFTGVTTTTAKLELT